MNDENSLVTWTNVIYGLHALSVFIGVTSAATIAAFRRHSQWAGILMMPYIAWVTFATALNFAIWRLN